MSMVYDIMNDKQRKDYEEVLREWTSRLRFPGLARFRVNAFNQDRGAGGGFPDHPVQNSDASKN